MVEEVVVERGVCVKTDWGGGESVGGEVGVGKRKGQNLRKIE